MPSDAELEAASVDLWRAIDAMRVGDYDAVSEAMNANRHLDPCVVALTLGSVLSSSIDRPGVPSLMVVEAFYDDETPTEEREALETAGAIVAAVGNHDLDGAHALIHRCDMRTISLTIAVLLRLAADHAEPNE